MLDTLTQEWSLAAALLVGLLVLAGSGALVMRRWLSKYRDRTEKKALQQISELREQVQSLQTDVRHLKRNQRATTPYGQAILMAQQGLDAREVAAVCGLSRGEAELIVALYKTHYS
ncbi:MAG: DUF2802 domain-containing protein [Burkholderiales bacterium]|nr:DUF2802 domain-containing protein [Burkholderiales bacterium]